MKYIFFALVVLLNVCHSNGQIYMNIEYNNSTISIPEASIDSIVYTQAEPVFKKIYLQNGSIFSIKLQDIDTIYESGIDVSSYPIIQMNQITDITPNSFVVNASVLSSGEGTLTQRGVCISTSPMPSLSDVIFIDSNLNLGVYSVLVSQLLNSTYYYVRAFATNEFGTIYSNQIIIQTPLFSMGSGVSDIDGNFYTTLIYGNGQEWMQNNLNTSKYSNGDDIIHYPNSSGWNSGSDGKWVFHGNNPSMSNPYGKLYNGWAVQDSRNLCPTGWHVPTQQEWFSFFTYLGGEEQVREKLMDTLLWTDAVSGSPVPTNESGFSMTPAGSRSQSGNFDIVGNTGYLWSSTFYPQGFSNLWLFYVTYNGITINYFNYPQSMAMSVRCIKD